MQLPKALASSEWLGYFYGGVPHTVREIYVGGLDWFDGDLTTLAPIHWCAWTPQTPSPATSRPKRCA
ncbi:alkyl sulfatase dimerization domain-containing protein [Nocardia sp. NPDC051833]|uniref:alkyl sulfatase dimerization domain-containing protein n=1 Tax=Nocardia sp. NPDC051833 TaxID=3155674 RepID=UPI0034414029